MFIHWFPGHMTKAMRIMEKQIALVDCVVYVLDARAPLSCINTSFDEIIGKKPRIYVLNKCDTVSEADLNCWTKYFRKFAPCIQANSLSKSDSKKIVDAILQVNDNMIKKYASKGVTKTVRAMVLGVPNTGKSTLINSLSTEKKAVTGNRPGVTKGTQWVKIDKNIDLLDSPGVLFPDFSDQNKATRLALIGSIKDDILDISELAFEGLNYFRKEYPLELKERFSLSFDEDTATLELMENIGQSRGFLLRGGDIDFDRVAKTIITDFRKGYMGKLVLEKPENE